MKMRNKMVDKEELTPKDFVIHEIWETEDGRAFMVSFMSVRTESSIEPQNLVRNCNSRRLGRWEEEK